MEKLISFLNNSISPYHAVNSLEQELIKNGFKKVNENLIIYDIIVLCKFW